MAPVAMFLVERIGLVDGRLRAAAKTWLSCPARTFYDLYQDWSDAIELSCCRAVRFHWTRADEVWSVRSDPAGVLDDDLAALNLTPAIKFKTMLARNMQTIDVDLGGDGDGELLTPPLLLATENLGKPSIQLFTAELQFDSLDGLPDVSGYFERPRTNEGEEAAWSFPGLPRKDWLPGQIESASGKSNPVFYRLLDSLGGVRHRLELFGPSLDSLEQGRLSLSRRAFGTTEQPRTANIAILIREEV